MRAFAFLFFMAAGCASVDVGVTEQAQIDPGMSSWSEYSLWLEDGSLVAEILVMGGRDAGAYEAYTEYWTVDRSRLGALGRRSMLITRESGDADPPQPDLVMADPPGVADPPEPDLGEVDPPDPDLQMFTQPVYPEGGWGRGFVGDPFIGGVLLQSADGIGLRLFVEGGEISRVVWYQAISRTEQPTNVLPEGVLRVGTSFNISNGMIGYAIDLAVE